MDAALFSTRVIVGAPLLALATLSLVTSYGAQIVNARAYRRRAHNGESHAGASHVSDVWLVPTILGSVAALLLPWWPVRLFALGVAVLDAVPLAVAWLASYGVRRSRTGSSPPPR
jgi:hypothetical protein